MNMYDITTSRHNNHQIRLGMDYAFTDKHLLSLVYTTAFTDVKPYATVTGAQNSVTDSHSEGQLHNAKLDYQTPFGLKAGIYLLSCSWQSAALQHTGRRNTELPEQR